MGEDRLAIIKNKVAGISEVSEDDKKDCVHFDEIQEVTPSSSKGCEQCLAMGDTWVNLRLCMTCGQVGCCVEKGSVLLTHNHGGVEAVEEHASCTVALACVSAAL